MKRIKSFREQIEKSEQTASLLLADQNIMKGQILARVKLVTNAPRPYKGQLIAIAEAHLLGSNQHPHFSVTGEISTPRERERGDAQCCGCIHEKILKKFPQLKPLVDLHLSNADDGEPSYAEANGFYNLAGCVGHHFGEQYHAGNSQRHFPITPAPETPWKDTEYRYPTEDECLTLAAKYLRTTREHVALALRECLEAFETGKRTVATSEEVTPVCEKERVKVGRAFAKAHWRRFIDAQRERWQAEAVAGLELIHKLKAKQDAAKAEREAVEAKGGAK